MNWSILHRYLSGESSPEEERQVEEWLNASEYNRRYMDSLKKIWYVEPGDEIEVDAGSAWKSFQEKVFDEEEKTEKEIPAKEFGNHTGRFRPLLGKRYNRFLVVSLSAAAVILIAFLFSPYMPVADEGAPMQSQMAMQEVMTKKGQQNTLRLSDGSLVQLNADSKLEIPGDFMNFTRELHLKGEAYFEVTHNPEKPFVVYAGNSATRVLGTKFGVRAYPEEQTEVVVTEGKVALKHESGSMDGDIKQIGRNQRGVLSESGRIEVSPANNVRQYLGWKDEELVFKDTPLRRVRSQLERWFDINCSVADPSLDELRITASFKDEPMNEVLVVIALSMDITYDREGRNIVFRKN